MPLNRVSLHINSNTNPKKNNNYAPESHNRHHVLPEGNFAFETIPGIISTWWNQQSTVRCFGTNLIPATEDREGLIYGIQTL